MCECDIVGYWLSICGHSDEYKGTTLLLVLSKGMSKWENSTSSKVSHSLHTSARIVCVCTTSEKTEDFIAAKDISIYKYIM